MKTKTIFIDITRLIERAVKQHYTGIDRVMLAYIQHYKANAQAVFSIQEYCFILPKTISTKIFENFYSSEFSFKDKLPSKNNLKILRKIILILKNVKMLACFFWYLQKIFLKLRKKIVKGCFLNISHSELKFLNYPKFFDQKNIISVFMLYDLIPIEYPEYCKPVARGNHVNILNNMLTKAKMIVVNSYATLNTLNKYAIKNNYSLPSTICAPLAQGNFLNRTLETQLVAKPYFVILGTIEARKNHLLILQLWRRLIELLQDKAPRLVIIGQRGWECESVIDILEWCQQLKGFVIEHAASDAEATTYLKHAQALLFPSFAEGYGLPLVEALSLGTPVIASNLAVFREIAGDIPEYLDSLDGKGWLDMIIDYSKTNSAHRAAQLKRISSFQIPTWIEHFVKVDRFLEKFGEHR